MNLSALHRRLLAYPLVITGGYTVQVHAWSSASARGPNTGQSLLSMT
ncbi:hypothetical protein ACF07H_00240 [Streptomyces huasconensis]